MKSTSGILMAIIFGCFPPIAGLHAQESEAPSVPYSAVVIKASPRTGDVSNTVVGEIVTVSETDRDQSFVIDEQGFRRWVTTNTLIPRDAASDELAKRLAKSPTDSDLLYANAVLAHHLSRNEEALKYSQQLIKHHPDFPHAYINHSRILTSMRRYKDAVKVCDEGMRRFPESSITLVNRGLAYDRLGDQAKALADYAEAIKIDQNILAMNNRASILMDQKRFDEAVVQLNAAIAVRSADLLLRNRGKAHQQLGDIAQAREDFGRAIELNPGSKANYLARGRFLFGFEQESALQDLIKALELAPDDPEILTDVGAAQGTLGQYEKGVEYLSRALQIAPNNGLANANMAFVLFRQDKATEALPFADAATKNAPELLLGHTNRAAILHDLGRYADEIESYSAAISLDPDNIDHLNGRGMAYLSMKECDAAIKDFEACLKKDPNEGEYLTNVGQSHAKAGRLDQAMTFYNKSIEVDPKYDFAHYKRGLLYLDQKNNAENAVRDLTEATTLDSAWLLGWHHLGRAHRAAGDPEKARDAYTKALEINQNYVPALVNRSNVLLALSEHELAKQDALQAVELDPLEYNATYNLGLSLYHLDKPAQAILHLSVLVGAGEASSIVFNRRGDSFQDLGRFEDAVADYTRSLEIDAKSPSVYHARAYSLAKLERVEEAIKDYTRALEIDSSRLNTRYQRAHLFRGSGKYVEAAADYQTVHEADPTEVNPRLNLAAVLAAGNDAAVRDGDRALQLATAICEDTEWKSVVPIAILALAHAETGDFVAAQKTAQRSLDLADDSDAFAPPWLPDAIEKFANEKPWRFSP